jgi:hypothetical protein
VKLRVLAIAAALLAVTGSSNAGFFFFLPIGAIQNAVQGSHCVSATAKVGDRINLGGKNWVVKETNGVSSRCSQYPNWPVVAKLEPYLSEAELASEIQVCLPMGASQGSSITLQGLGEVYVRSVSSVGSECSDTRAPMSARVVRAQYANQPATSQPSTSGHDSQATTPAADPPKSPQPEPVVNATAPEPPKIVPVVATQPLLKEAKSVVERLRELKQLRDENLISEPVYESKQRDILSGQ